MGKKSEHHLQSTFSRNCFEKFVIINANSWQELSEYAQKTITEAEKSLKNKHYKLFGMYLKQYSDIWKYAYAQLEPKEYRCFCAEQCEADGNYVM